MWNTQVLYVRLFEFFIYWRVAKKIPEAVEIMFRIVFWDVLPCKIIVDRRFRGTYCLHHQGWVSLARKDRVYVGVQWTGLTWFLTYRLSFPIDQPNTLDSYITAFLSLIPDDGGSTYLWNVARQLFYTAVHPRRQFWTSYSPPWELGISHVEIMFEYTRNSFASLQYGTYKDDSLPGYCPVKSRTCR
jgi:hypothetical protein